MLEHELRLMQIAMTTLVVAILDPPLLGALGLDIVPIGGRVKRLEVRRAQPCFYRPHDGTSGNVRRFRTRDPTRSANAPAREDDAIDEDGADERQHLANDPVEAETF